MKKKNNFYIKNNFNKKVLESFLSFRVSEERTLEILKKVNNKYGLVLDPHTAVGFSASLEYLESNKDDIAVSMATAHPAKFSEAVFQAINKEPTLPARYRDIFNLEEKFEVIENKYERIKNYIYKNSLI